MMTKFLDCHYLIILALYISIGKCMSYVSTNQSYHRLNTRSASSLIYNENYYHNLVTFVEIKNNFEIFPFKSKNENYNLADEINKIVDFNEISIDHKEKSIYVGARNYLIKFSYENESLQIKNFNSDIIAWEPNIDAITDCKKTVRTDKYCHNYVRLIAVQDKKLLACATYANRPICTWRSKIDLNNVLDQFDGMGKIAQTPDSSLTYLQTKNGDFYFATSIDYSEQGMRPDYLIERSLGSSIQVRTDQYNSNWLNEPVFVGSIELGNYVYFFIRETAIESMNCGEKIYSRVVRLCKYDQGIENVMIWKHFEKTRLNCSIPSHNQNSNIDKSTNSYIKMDNEYPFYFDEVQNIYFDKQKKLIYALFSQPYNGIKSSAVCVYDIKSIENAFSGPFKHQKTQSSIWEPFYDHNSPKCEPNAINSSPSNKYQLKHLSVQPLFQKPILVLPNRKVTKIVVDTVLTKHQNNIDVLFLATETNTILKYMLLNIETVSSSSSNINPSVCHLEELELFESKTTKQLNLINNLMLLENNLDEDYLSKSRSLLIASSLNFMKIPVSNCKAQTNYFSCLSLMDPYCVWDSKVQKCLLIFNAYNEQKSSQNGNRLNTHLHQHSINQCPSTNIPVDGGFSEWSTWTTCTLAKTSSEKCKCRTRICNSPEPRNGGKNCDESQSIEIQDCQVDGGWTAWSAWSACKQTSCDSQIASQPAIRTRTRTCTNPEPKNNGRLCVGLDQEEEICTQEMINPCGTLQHSSSNHQWMNWGSWEECSKPCGEGFQMRRRLCNGKNCIGGNQEWRVCNSEPCKEKNEDLIKEWEIIEIDYELKQKLERRIKFMCKYDPNYLLDSVNFLELNSTFEYRICDLNDNNLNDQCRYIDQSKELLGLYSQWSEWSKCSKDCMENEKQYRTRKCSISHSCFGPDKETRDCECTNIASKNNNKYLEFTWSCWSSFTPCSVKCGKGTQKRTRQCLSSDPLNCLGPKEQTENCFGTNCSFYETLAHSFSNNSHIIKNGFNLIHVVVIAILAFLLGSTSVLMVICINSKRNRKSSLLCGCCRSSSDSKLNNSCSKNNIKLHNTSANSNDKQFFSLDHNSLESDTANTEIMINNNSDSSKFSDNSSSASTTHSAIHQTHHHSKEYFTIGGGTNRFIDPTNLSLLNNIEDNEEDFSNILGINSSNTLNSKMIKNNNNGLLKASQNNNKNFDLPNKSFNTYTNQTTNSILNNKNSSSIKALSNNSNSNSTTNSNNTLRYSNFFNNQTGSIRSNFNNNNNNNNNNKQRQPISSLMRTNLDQEL